MTWNYRLVQIAEGWVEVKEVYYDSAGRPEAYSDTTLGGETVDDLRRSLGHIGEALAQPVLTLNECGRLVFPED